MRRIIFILLCLINTLPTFGQPTQLVYLKTDGPNSQPVLSFPESPAEYTRIFYNSEVNEAIFPWQNPVQIFPMLNNGALHLLYTNDFDVLGHFETNALLNSIRLLKPFEAGYVYSQKANFVHSLNLFDSYPSLSDNDNSSIISSTYLLTFDPAENTLKMPFHCSCLDYQGDGPSTHILYPSFGYQIGITNAFVGRYNAAWMSDSTVVMTLNVYDDIILNWDDNYTIGDNYWGTFWVKINPLTGFYIATPMLSQNGTALDYSLNGTENGNHLYRIGMVRGNGVQMSPDGTIWDTFEGDSLNYAYLIKENTIGEQSWMAPLFSYQNALTDSLSGSIPLNFAASKVFEMDSNAYLGTYLRIAINEGNDTLFYDNYMDGVDTLPSVEEYDYQLVINTSEVTRFDENGESVSKLSLSLRNPNAYAAYNAAWYNWWPDLYKINDKLGWPLKYYAETDTTLYFLKAYSDGTLDSTGLDMPAGRGTFLVWLDKYLDIVDVLNIPFSTDNLSAEGVTIKSVSLYHGDSLMISGNISGGTTTSLDPKGLAESITYDAKNSFVAFYSLPDYLTGIELTSVSEKNKLHIFPNPAKDRITVQTNYPFPVSYTVIDITGRQIAHGEIPVSDKKHRISVSNFEPGIYLLVLKKNRELLVTRKFMVY